jgi:DNA-binding CsgD family transcriptional regulator
MTATRAQINLVIVLVNEGKPVEYIARRARVSPRVVRDWIERGSLHGAPDIEGHAAQHAPWHDVIGTDEETGHRVYGPERLPISPRTGRPAAQESTERDYSMEYSAIGSGGLWDSEEDARMRPQKRPLGERYDTKRMAAFVARSSTQMTPRQFEIYTLFWVQRMSYGTVARRLGSKPARIFEAVKELRKKAGA